MKCHEGRAFTMHFYSAPCCLPVIRAALEVMCGQMGFDENAIGNIILSVDEALTNIIKHAYKGRDDQPVEMEVTPLNLSPAQLRIRLRDYGRVVHPSQIKGRDLDDIRPGGLGVHIMNKCMDSVTYEPADGGGTLLTLVKTQREAKGQSA